MLTRTYTETIYVHCRKIYNLFVHLQKQLEKRAFGQSFCPISQRIQMNYISLTMYAYCIYAAMSKKAKSIAKWSKKSRNKHCSNILMVPSVKTGLIILLLFLTVAQRESDIRRPISWSVSVYNIKIIQSLQFDCSNKEGGNRVIRVHVYRSSF